MLLGKVDAFMHLPITLGMPQMNRVVEQSDEGSLLCSEAPDSKGKKLSQGEAMRKWCQKN
jgi:hypothetical protein